MVYNSCRNRHCPKCQGAARADWLEQREQELLDVEYFHVVFTLPSELAPLALQNRRAVYGMLFRAASETLLTIARDPKHLGAEIGCMAVLPSALGKTDPDVLAMNDPWTEHDREHVITGGTKGAVSCCGV